MENNQNKQITKQKLSNECIASKILGPDRYLRRVIAVRRPELLPYIDLSNFNWYGIKVAYVDFRNTNINLDPQTVYEKNLRGCIFDGLDLKDMDFKDCDIRGASFEDCIGGKNFDKAITFENRIKSR